MVRPIAKMLVILGAAILAACGGGGGGGGASGTGVSGNLNTGGSGPSGPHGLTSLFFLHHSTGDGLVVGGNMRGTVASYNSSHSTGFVFWDHGYNGDGLRNGAGNFTGTSYNIPGDNTDTDGLWMLWTSSDPGWTSSRNQILANHQVIAFKSCFTILPGLNPTTLEQWEAYYLAMRNFFDTRTDRLFIVMTPPPLHRNETNSTEAGLARQFANWLSSPAYLDGHPNVRCFNLFNYLAQADDGSLYANMLRTDYESGDSHPNDLGNATVGPIFAQFLIAAASSY